MTTGEYEEKNRGYKNLLKVITMDFKDNKKHPNSVLCVYDMWNDEQLVAVFYTVPQIVHITKISQAVIEWDISRGALLRNRYLIKRIYFDKNVKK